MDLRHLRYFIAVAEELNFSRAAERLHIAQPPLSMQIRALEEEIKVQLFERDKRRVYLTPAGMQFLDRARAILRDVESAKDEVLSAATGQVGRLALGYTASSMLSPLLPAAICRFRQEFPQVQLSLHEQTSLDQLVAINERRLDLGILRRPHVLIPEGISVMQWYRSSLLAAIPQGHRLGRAPLRMADLDGEVLITYPRDSGIGLYWKVQDLCAKAAIKARHMHEIRDVATMVGLVAAGVGIALVPDGASCIRSDGVVYQKLLDKEAVSSLYMAYRSAAHNGFTTQMIKLLCEARKDA